MPGLVAFWDFVKREPDGARRFTAHVPAESTNDYPLDAANYIKDYWGVGREATYADFPLLGRGPFGNAIRIVKESDPDFRPFLYVPRSRLHDTPLDIKGAGKSVSVVVWAIRESGNHALAGIWHEGTDLKQSETASIAKVERGQRQYALFAGLNKQGKRLWPCLGERGELLSEQVRAAQMQFRRRLTRSPGRFARRGIRQIVAMLRDDF